MRFLRAKNGQSMAEYAILFAIVIGAAIAMQQYVKTRLQGGMQGASDDYINQIGSAAGFAVAPFEPDRTSNSTSNQNDALNMSTASTGARTLTSDSKTQSVVTK